MSDYLGKEIQVITDLEMDINLVDFDFKNNRVAFTAFEVAKQKPVASKVYTYDTSSEELQMFTQSQFRIDGIKSMDHETVFLQALI